MTELVLKTKEETEALGKKLADEAFPGEVIALIGDLGTGKTTLTKAIAKGLGIGETLTSPTFTIVCEYDSGRMPLYHFDVYRVHDTDELFEIGFEDYLRKKGLCVIEWADLLEDGLLPDNTVTIRLAYGDSDDERTVCIS
jgi:tRNA threonylcarbamoyladenosine biosynthesis protein TsaE